MALVQRAPQIIPIERASRSVVNQVESARIYVEVEFCCYTQHFWHFGAKQSVQKRPSKCNLLAIRSVFGTRQNAANFSDVHFCCPAQHFLALFLKSRCFRFLLVLLARPVPVINLPGPALTIYVGPVWASSWAVGGQFLLACAVFLALRPESIALTSLKGIFCHLFAEVYLCRHAQCFWPFSPNSRPNSQRESAS